MKQYESQIHCNLHGGDRWAAEAKWGIRAQKFLDFSASINPLGPPASALEAIKENLHLVEYYPEPNGLALKSKLAEYLEIDQPIVLANGSSELIYLCTRLFAGNRIMVLNPCFSEYGRGGDNIELINIKLNLDDCRLPLQEINEQLVPGDLIFIANPNNPTGNIFSRAELLELLEVVRQRNAALVMDETFIDFCEDSSLSLRDISSHEANLVIIGSLTKFFALPGLRIGYALSSMENLKKMEQLLPPWRVNSLALAAGVAALQDKEYIQATVKLINQERNYLINGLNSIEGFWAYPSQANFILVSTISRGITAAELQNRLGPEGILIRDCGNFYNLSAYHFRVAVRSHAENQTLLQTLRKVLD